MEFRDLRTQYKILQKAIDEEIQDTLNKGRFIGGEKVSELEQNLKDTVGVKHCVSCGNGTDAITLALMAWEIGEGDAVFVPDFTFFSSGECPAALGATPFFIDVKQDTYNLDPDDLEQSIIKVEDKGKYKPRAVIAVDLFGLPAEFDKIKDICKRHGLLLLEDGAQGFGGSIDGKKACSFGDISTTSFFPAKPLGCYGDGGAVFTNNDDWAETIRSICVHGKNGGDKYDNCRIGMNSRLDAIQAAVLLPKLKAFTDNELKDVNQVATWYTDRLSGSELIIPKVEKGFVSSWAQYTVQLPEIVDRSTAQTKMKEQGIPTMVYYMKPMHKQGAFKGTDSAIADCPMTETLCKTVLSLPMHPYLTEDEVDFVSNTLLDAIKG